MSAMSLANRRLRSDMVWFSNREERRKVGFFGKFSWTGVKEIWDWDSCTIGLARTAEDERLKVVVRSSTTKISRYMGRRPVGIRYMLGFDVKGKPLEPRTEAYTARKNIPKQKEGPKNRWVLQLDDDHWIWEWALDGADITSSTTYKLYQEIRNEIEHPSKEGTNIFDVDVDRQDERLIPVVYQPSIDSLKNFVREIHCAKGPTGRDGCLEVDVTLIFNDERLRKHGFLNTLYEAVRIVLYRRKLDVESFKILARESPVDNGFIFEAIYSDQHEMNDDSIHGDKPLPPAPEHPTKYYFMNNKHPIVFVNTSNHAMAEHDTNDRLWKWEYVPWLEDSPVKLGEETRQQIEARFK